MNNKNTDITIDEIIEKIHKEVFARKLSAGTTLLNGESAGGRIGGGMTPSDMGRPTMFLVFAMRIRRILEAMNLTPLVELLGRLYPARWKNWSVIDVRDLLGRHDAEFIGNAYRSILKREPEDAGFNYHLDILRRRHLTKIEILNMMRYSKEGRMKHVRVHGLTRRYLACRLESIIRRIPVIGYCMAVVLELLSLPGLRRRCYESEVLIHGRITMIAGELLSKLEKKADIPENLYEPPGMDDLGVSFLNWFRGSRDDIKRRLAVYVPRMEKLKRDLLDGPVLDLACGRGEWLELMGEQGFDARGVDSNGILVRQCHSMNMNVIRAEVPAFLKSLGDGSCMAITGFHIVEHLGLNALLTLIDESLRVLKPGGIIILETPNPENIIVGSCEFYTDMTHEKPVPPKVLEFLLKARGFGNVSVMRLNPLPPVEYPDSGELKSIVDSLNAGMDYSVVAEKAR